LAFVAIKQEEVEKNLDEGWSKSSIMRFGDGPILFLMGNHGAHNQKDQGKRVKMDSKIVGWLVRF
jgi:hypothetical protein